MLILLTNDDGIEAEGLHVLAQRFSAAGHDLVVAAPAGDASGSGAALGMFHADSHIDVARMEIPDCGAPAWSVDGPPGLCTLAARLGAFGPPPDVVVSGINAGLNTGRAILHSGTVGAALTARTSVPRASPSVCSHRRRPRPRGGSTPRPRSRSRFSISSSPHRHGRC